MSKIWRIRIQYYSISFILIWVSAYIDKYIVNHFIGPFIAGILLMYIFGRYMTKVERNMNDDGTFKEDGEE